MKFTGNSSVKGGGAIDVAANNLKIDDGIVFSNNLAANGAGGAISTDSGSTTNIGNNASFTGNTTGTNGGAIANAGEMTEGGCVHPMW